VAFFDPGSVLQLSLSVVVSVLALIYHVSANPFKQQFLNGMIMWDFFSVFSRFILPFCWSWSNSFTRGFAVLDLDDLSRYNLSRGSGFGGRYYFCGSIVLKKITAGIMLAQTKPATVAGDGVVIALAIVNLFLIVSPIITFLLLGMRVCWLSLSI
jgi:hypothetical protein